MLKFKNLFGIFLDWFEFCGSYNVQDAWILVILCLDWSQYLYGCFILHFFFSSYSLNLFLKLFHRIFYQHSESILKSSSSLVAYMLLSFHMESSWKLKVFFFLGWPGSTHLTRNPVIRPGRPPGRVSKLWSKHPFAFTRGINATGREKWALFSKWAACSCLLPPLKNLLATAACTTFECWRKRETKGMTEVVEAMEGEGVQTPSP